MFIINGNNLYKWHNLILVLSLSRTEILVETTEFPLIKNILTIRDISRKFIIEYHSIQDNTSNKDSFHDRIKPLFDSTFETLSEIFGNEEAEKLCSWGNSLHLDTPDESHLLNLWQLGFIQLIENAGFSKLINIIDSQKIQVMALITLFDSEMKGCSKAIEYLEKIPHDQWDILAYNHYYPKDAQAEKAIETIISPMSYLEGIIYFIKIRKAICTINKSLSDEEKISLITFFQENGLGNMKNDFIASICID